MSGGARRLRRAAGLAILITLGAGACAAPAPAPGPSDLRSDTAVANAAIAFLAERHARDPWNPVLAGRLADRYLQRFGVTADLADLDRAERVARSILPVAPNRAVAHARLSLILLSRHDFGGALAAAEAAWAADSSNVSALGTLFDAALAAGRYDRAADALAGLREPSLIRTLRYARWAGLHGDDLAAEEHLREACAAIERSVLRPGVKAWCFTELADLLAAAYGADSAGPYLRLAFRHQPDYRGAVEKRADLAYAARDWASARTHYARIAVDAHPDLYLRLAEVHEYLGEPDAARRYEARFEAIASDPRHEALFALPLARYLSRDPSRLDEALAVIERDLTRRQAVETYEVLAWVQFRRGAYDAALAALDAAGRFGQPSVTREYQRALVLEAIGRSGEADALRRGVEARLSDLEPHAYRAWRAGPA